MILFLITLNNIRFPRGINCIFDYDTRAEFNLIDLTLFFMWNSSLWKAVPASLLWDQWLKKKKTCKMKHLYEHDLYKLQKNIFKK